MSFRISPVWWPALAVTSPVIVPWLLIRNNHFQEDRARAAELNRVLINQAEPLEIPEVNFLELTVLVELKTKEGFVGDAGVSYLVKTELGSILYDIGFGATRPALIHNTAKLGFHLDQVDALVISHLHSDHMGGMPAQRSRQVTVPDELMSPEPKPCFLPDRAGAKGFKGELVERPQLLTAGIASTGPLARSLFMFGFTEEQALLARGKDKGLMIFTGCGHPTIEVVLAMVRQLSNEPLYAVCGGLHFPVTGGRGNRAGIQFQTLVGTGKPPWQRVTDEDLSRTIAVINSAGPKRVYLSGHDTCDHALDRMTRELNAETEVLEAGVSRDRKIQMKPILLSVVLLLGILACTLQGGIPETPGEPPTPIPSGVLIDEIPANMDIIFDSIRYVLNDTTCLDEKFKVDPNFINLPGCNALIYDPQDNKLASTRQLFAMDIETGEVVQITNTDCSFTLGQAVDSSTLMTLAICSDTDNNGKINENDKPEIYLLYLPSGEMNCLTCEFDLTSINNPDYSTANKKIVFSAQHSTAFHNYLFSIDTQKNLLQLTDQTNFMDFDCSWSEDGTKIVFSRLAEPWFATPSQVWLMDSDGTNQEKITNGGANPNNESNHGPYPIGIDADPDLSPDNKKIVLSRLKTGQENVPFGVYELIVVDVETKEIEVLDSHYANMMPQWKSGGILINRQVGVSNSSEMKAMDMKQSLYVYRDEKFEELEGYPFNIFPLGAYGGYWIGRE